MLNRLKKRYICKGNYCLTKIKHYEKDNYFSNARHCRLERKCTNRLHNELMIYTVSVINVATNTVTANYNYQ